MAGSYPDAPFRRMAWDDDGTVLWFSLTVGNVYSGTVVPGTERTIAQNGAHNNESTISGSNIVNCDNFIGTTGGQGFFMIFTEPRDIYGMNYWCQATINTPGDPNRRNVPMSVEGSADSLNGLDGTWTSIFSGTSYPQLTPWSETVPNDGTPTYSWDHWYRVGIVTTNFPVTGRRAIRWIQERGEGLIGNSFWHHIHLYGDKSAGATPDRLLIIDDDTGLEFTGPLDWGDVPRGAVFTKDFKLRNNSAALTANGVSLAFESLTGTSHAWYALSDSGGAFAGSLSGITIAPTADYPAADDITLRLTAAGNESLGHNSARMQVSTTSWT